MERRGFFKSLLGVLALPFAKDLVKAAPAPKSDANISFIGYSQAVPVHIGLTGNQWSYWSASHFSNGDVICTNASTMDIAANEAGKVWGDYVDRQIEDVWSAT